MTNQVFIYPGETHNLEVSEAQTSRTLNELMEEICQEEYYRDGDIDSPTQPANLQTLKLQIKKNRNFYKPSQKEVLVKPFFEKYEEGNDIYCKGYLSYLMNCWFLDLGIEIAPCYIWNVILWRFAKIVNEDPETYRSIFTTSSETQTVNMNSGEFSPEEFFESIKSKIPTNTDCWFPDFQYKPEMYDLSMKGLFAEVVEKFYSCFIYGCGIPKVRLIGNKSEWSKIIDAIDKIPIKGHAYKQTAREIVQQMIKNLNNSEYWSTEFFRGTRCGSGSQTEFGGAIMRLAGCNIAIDEVPCILSKFGFEDANLSHSKKWSKEHLGSNGGVKFTHHSGIMSAKIDSEGIAVPVYDQRVTIPNVDHGKMTEEELKTTILTYRYQKALKAIKDRNRKVTRKFYKINDPLQVAVNAGKQEGGNTQEAIKAKAREIWTRLTNHRSAKARRAERFIVKNLPELFKLEVALPSLYSLYSLRIHLAVLHYFSMRNEDREMEKVSKLFKIHFTQEEIEGFFDKEEKYKPLRSKL